MSNYLALPFFVYVPVQAFFASKLITYVRSSAASECHERWSWSEVMPLKSRCGRERIITTWKLCAVLTNLCPLLSFTTRMVYTLINTDVEGCFNRTVPVVKTRYNRSCWNYLRSMIATTVRIVLRFLHGLSIVKLWQLVDVFKKYFGLVLDMLHELGQWESDA